MHLISCYVIASAKRRNILSLLSSLLFNLFRLCILWWVIYACPWGKAIWPIVFYRPKILLMHGRCSVVTSSLVILQIETRYAYIENYASTYDLMIFCLWVFEIYEWTNFSGYVVGQQIDHEHSFNFDLVSLVPWRLHLLI